MKPVCVPCRRFFRCTKNGFAFTEGMSTVEPAQWLPYKIWRGDLWTCEGCGAEIISGVGSQPIAIQHQPHFDDLNEDSQLQVNDC